MDPYTPPPNKEQTSSNNVQPDDSEKNPVQWPHTGVMQWYAHVIICTRKICVVNSSMSKTIRARISSSRWTENYANSCRVRAMNFQYTHVGTVARTTMKQYKWGASNFLVHFEFNIHNSCAEAVFFFAFITRCSAKTITLGGRLQLVIFQYSYLNGIWTHLEGGSHATSVFYAYDVDSTVAQIRPTVVIRLFLFQVAWLGKWKAKPWSELVEKTYRAIIGGSWADAWWCKGFEACWKHGSADSAGSWQAEFGAASGDICRQIQTLSSQHITRCSFCDSVYTWFDWNSWCAPVSSIGLEEGFLGQLPTVLFVVSNRAGTGMPAINGMESYARGFAVIRRIYIRSEAMSSGIHLQYSNDQTS